MLGNGLLELQRHKYTTKYLKTFHKALQGHKPSFLLGLAALKNISNLSLPSSAFQVQAEVKIGNYLKMNFINLFRICSPKSVNS